MTEASVTALVTLATVVAGFVFQLIRGERQHQWDLADRRMAQAEAREIAAQLARKVVGTAEALASTALMNQVEIVQQIADNTALTQIAGEKADAAYQEANHVNLKISDLNAQLLRQGKKDTE